MKRERKIEKDKERRGTEREREGGERDRQTDRQIDMQRETDR